MRLPRKDLPSHLTEGLVTHVSLQLTDLKEENKRLKQQVGKLTEDLKTHDELKQQVEKLTRDLSAYQIGTPLCPVEITMTDFEQHKKDGDCWYSPPFYTRPKGYKMRLQVFAGGYGSGANTHVTLSLSLMKGEYDEQLEWPLQGKFTIELLSQDGDGKRSETINFDNAPETSSSRVMDGERAEKG